jgi:hypothetical protein
MKGRDAVNIGPRRRVRGRENSIWICLQRLYFYGIVYSSAKAKACSKSSSSVNMAGGGAFP